MNLKCSFSTIIVFSALNLVTDDAVATVTIVLIAAYAGEITDSEHRTKAATEKLPALVCYRCDTMADGEKCAELKENSTSFLSNCSDENRICQVKRISVTTINKTGEVGNQKLWMLQRNCVGTCEPGCIIIGERTKLNSCTTCCEKSSCNYGNSGDSYFYKRRLQLLDLIYFYFFGFIFLMKT
ncbi:hypothetical protein ILUMI_01659 [Ignelater luminosus]|uniref:Uncharacterized protein n=1 Tax=Ignelater luminosus TaxID=2038154 RepID=A0A8K0DJT7_IGNLU|nr:hypothetical protein ILUMI_01659 [Ignelater luminosus]